MQPMYKGLPELFEYVIGLVERCPHRDTKSIVAFQLLRDILNATELAIIHYFALTLSEPFLQNSQHGTPYQKWALVTNENFQKVDQYVKSLTPIIEHFLWPHSVLESPDDNLKTICVRFCRLRNEYACCEVNQSEPLLTVSEISFAGWLDTASGRSNSSSELTLERPPVVIKSVIPITDRSVLKNLQKAGVKQVEDLRGLLIPFATWLEANYTLSDFITVPPKKPLRNYGIISESFRGQTDDENLA